MIQKYPFNFIAATLNLQKGIRVIFPHDERQKRFSLKALQKDEELDSTKAKSCTGWNQLSGTQETAKLPAILELNPHMTT